MFLKCSVIHYDVVQVYDDEAVEGRLMNLIHKSTKHGWCIGDAKQHYKEFERVVPNYACRLWLVSLGNPNLVSFGV